MSLDDTGIIKPFDRVLKSFADEAPELLLRLLGLAPAGSNLDIQPLRPETAPTVVSPDYAASVRVASETPFIAHAEFVTATGGTRPVTSHGMEAAWHGSIRSR